MTAPSGTEILIAGATSALGRATLALCRERGHRVRALARSESRLQSVDADERIARDITNATEIGAAVRGIDTVFSCAGQSVGPDSSNRGPGYHAVDFTGNRNLLEAAKRAGVRRFVYISVFRAADFPEVAYLKAHAAVERLIRDSGLSHALIQPTGFFSVFDALFDMARRNRAVKFGDGGSRTNPIADADLAEICADAIDAAGNAEIPAGGPAIHTRHEILELAFAALGRPAKIRRMPAWTPSLMGTVAQPFAPRLGELMKFVRVIGEHDFVAPAHGNRTLEGYFRSLAGDGPASRR